MQDRRSHMRSRYRTGTSAPRRRPGDVREETAKPTRPSRPVRASRSRPQRPARTPKSRTQRSQRGQQHPLVKSWDNERLRGYEKSVKSTFDHIVPALKRISALQHEIDFIAQAQQIARDELGFELPENILANAWVDQLDMRRLFAWCVFANYQRFCDDFFHNDLLESEDEEAFDSFLQSCGFHTMDISPCADGRLAHMIRYVIRLPYRSVRRKSYAGAMFDIEDSIEKWVETEMLRHREGKPNSANDPTRYLKAVAYHYSSSNPDQEGCAAHGSDTKKAATAGLERLTAFQEAIENSFCCGASIDLLLIGVDTDTDAIRVHIPDADGQTDLERYVEATELFDQTMHQSESQAKETILKRIGATSSDVPEGTAKLIAQLVENNFSQIAYVKNFHGDLYEDVGHAERFIGAGIGFEEIQLRNLMYFAYLNTVEEGAPDLDVGIKIFKGLNVSQSLPVPVIVRFDYHGHVPGARNRAINRCARVSNALMERYEELASQGLLHIMQVVRNCNANANASIEVLSCTANPKPVAGGH